MSHQTNLHHRRTHNLLLIQKILSKPDTSPFTLVLDSVEQGAGALVRLCVGVGAVSAFLFFLSFGGFLFAVWCVVLVYMVLVFWFWMCVVGI